VKRFVTIKAIFILLLATPLTLLGQSARVLEYGSPGSADMDANRLDQAIRLYRDAVTRDDLRGAVLMVVRHGKIVLHEAIGWRHRGYQLPMEKDTLFRMASNTKPVVASAILILVQEGKLALDDRVSRYLESFNNGKSRNITVQQLLTHTSGFRIRSIFLPFDEKTDPHPTLRSAVDKFGREGPEVEPGKSYSYSNAGFNTAGAVIEHVSAMPLEEFLTRRIYEPLGMVDSSNHEDPAKLYRMATVYRGSVRPDGKVEFRQGFTPDDPPDFPIVRASGGMISTSMDYAKFLQMYLNGGRYGKAEILTRESVRKATSPIAKSSESAYYGLGWSVGKDAVFSHGGSDGTMAWVDPSLDLFGLVFTQSPGGNNPVTSFQKLVSEACLTK
jgi:CubicO group peptidase (beta-lactamase class C family)